MSVLSKPIRGRSDGMAGDPGQRSSFSEASRSFRGRSLEGADLSGRDLRGADFTGAKLNGASFRDSQLGLSPRVGLAFLGAGIASAVVAGVVIGWSVDRMRSRLSADRWDEVAEGSAVGMLLLILVAVILWKGFDLAIRVVAVAYIVVATADIVANLLWEEFEWLALLRATGLVVFLILAVGAGMLARTIGGVFGVWAASWRP